MTGHDTLVIYCHGFLSGKNYTAVPRFVELLGEKIDAVAFDFRGHGESEGRSTLGRLETLDLDAVMAYAARFNYRHILLLGSSMGGAVAIRYAAEHQTVAGVATIGAFADSRFSLIGMQALKLFRLPFSGRAVQLLRQARVADLQVEQAPADVVRLLSPRPLLLIHGELDLLVPRAHARTLYERAGEPKELVVIPRGGHDIPHLNRRTRDRIVSWAGEFLVPSPPGRG